MLPYIMDPDAVHKAGEAIIAALEEYTFGWANEEALNKVSRLADEAVYASGHHSYISEKATSIKSFAKILYSPRKHQKYAQGGQSGAERVRHIVYSDAYRLAHWAPVQQTEE
jgi:hypothetical protein